MASRTRSGRLLPALAVVVILVAAVPLACGPLAPATARVPPTTAPVATAADATTAPAPKAPPSASAPASIARRDTPPDATLSAEGGDPATGQLGTYLWLGTGSDSPWLPGALLTVGAGEPLSVRFDPDTEILAWTASSVPAGSQGPDGATTLAEGRGDPQFGAPGSGAWTVEVSVEFADAAGEASYFWRLEVE